MNNKRKQNSKVLMQQKRRRRKLITFLRVLKYGANSFVRNAWLSVAATAVMTITLVIIFGSIAAKTLLSDTVNALEDKIDISIYLKKTTKKDDIEKIQRSIEQLPSIKSVVYKSPDQIRDEFSIKNSNDESIRTALLEAEDRFFGTLNVKPVNPRQTDELKNLVETDELIKSSLDPQHKPTYKTERQKSIDNITNSMSFAEKIGLLVGVVFAIIASLIIFNTIRMAIFNRREEIYMMKLIGANKSFISGPFLVEAVICGVIAAIFANIICYAVIFSAKGRLELAGVAVKPLSKFIVSYAPLVVLMMMVTGALIGVVSSWFATRKYLKI